MTPKKPQTQRCGLADHDVGKYGEPVLVKERYLETIHGIRKNFDPSRTVCAGCYNAFKKSLLKNRHSSPKADNISDLELLELLAQLEES